MNMNLFKELVLSAPVSNRLQFGHNFNVIISAIDTSERKHEGIPIKANTFITFQQIIPDTRKVIAQSEFSFWNLDSESEFVFTNFRDELSCLISIVTALGKDDMEFATKFTELTDGEDVEELLTTKDGAKKVQAGLQGAFVESVKGSLGDNCPLLKCKLITNKKGYLEMDTVATWILPMNSEEDLPAITTKEVKRRAEAQTAVKTAKPDDLGFTKPVTIPTTESTPATVLPEKPVSKSAFGGL